MSNVTQGESYRCYSYSEIPAGDIWGTRYFIADDGNLYLTKHYNLGVYQDFKEYDTIKKANSFEERYKPFVKSLSLVTYDGGNMSLFAGSDEYHLYIDTDSQKISELSHGSYVDATLIFGNNTDAGDISCYTDENGIGITIKDASLRERLLMDPTIKLPLIGKKRILKYGKIEIKFIRSIMAVSDLIDLWDYAALNKRVLDGELDEYL